MTDDSNTDRNRMNASFRSGETLLSARLLTRDGVHAGLTDLILDTEEWRVRLLTADIQDWVPDQAVLLTPQRVADIDEAGGLIRLDMDAEDLKASPVVAFGEGLAGFGTAGIPLPPGWQALWRARIQPEGDVEAPPPPVDEQGVASDLGAATDLSADELIGAADLRGTRAETADGRTLRIRDILIDDSDWSLAYLDLEERSADAQGKVSSPRRYLLARSGIDWLNRVAGTLYLSVWVQELRDAPIEPLPVAGGAQTKLPTLRTVT